MTDIAQDGSEPLRRIIREEIAAALRDLAKEAADADMPYETRELESAGLQAVATAASRTARALAATVGTACEECGEVAPDHEWRCSRG